MSTIVPGRTRWSRRSSTGRLHDSWLTTGDDGAMVLAKNREKYLSRVVHVDVNGAEVVTGNGLLAAYLPSPFLFCLRCRVSYEQTRGQDFAKLASLSAEGRSSAMSVIGASIVRSLNAVTDPGFPAEVRRVLTYVDNRQDASLSSRPPPSCSTPGRPRPAPTSRWT